MIISHKYKFIFIKTNKTAGTSIEAYLSQYCGDEDILTPIKPHVEPHKARNFGGYSNPLPELIINRGHGYKRILKNFRKGQKFYNHISASAVRLRVSQEVWDSYYKFCVERNPWDKTLSYYNMVNKRSSSGLTLEEYFDRGIYPLNCPQYLDRKDNYLVDRVLRFENLDEELGEVFSQLGIPYEGTLNIYAKPSTAKKREHYKDVFTADQKELILKVFQKEIELHGYQY